MHDLSISPSVPPKQKSSAAPNIVNSDASLHPIRQPATPVKTNWLRHDGGLPGKSTVYAIAAGIDPRQLLPISLDTGCDVQSVREARFYCGLPRRRSRFVAITHSNAKSELANMPQLFVGEL
jgi:hypothetical protein